VLETWAQVRAAAGDWSRLVSGLARRLGLSALDGVSQGLSSRTGSLCACKSALRVKPEPESGSRGGRTGRRAWSFCPGAISLLGSVAAGQGGTDRKCRRGFLHRAATHTAESWRS